MALKLGAADLVIHGGGREHLDLIVHRLHALNAFHRFRGVIFDVRARDLAGQSYLFAIDPIREIVKHRVVGEQDKLMPYLVHEPGLIARTALRALGRHGT